MDCDGYSRSFTSAAKFPSANNLLVKFDNGYSSQETDNAIQSIEYGRACAEDSTGIYSKSHRWAVEDKSVMLKSNAKKGIMLGVFGYTDDQHDSFVNVRDVATRIDNRVFPLSTDMVSLMVRAWMNDNAQASTVTSMTEQSIALSGNVKEPICAVDCTHCVSGNCYLLMFERKYWQSLLREFWNEKPCLEQLVSLPMQYYRSHDFLMSLFITGTDGYYHVAHGTGLPLLVALISVAKIVDAPYDVRSFWNSYEYVNGIDPIKLNSLYGVNARSVIAGNRSSLRDFLSSELRDVKHDAKIEFLDTLDFMLLTKTAAMHGSADKNRLRVFEALGDAALTHVLAVVALSLNVDVQQLQSVRSSCTSNAALSALFVKVFDVNWFAYPSGVSMSSGNTGAKTFEAILGFIDLYFGMSVTVSIVARWNVLSLADSVNTEFSQFIGRSTITY